MSEIKDIAVFVDTIEDHQNLFEVAKYIATEHNARVTGICPIAPSLAPVDEFNQGALTHSDSVKTDDDVAAHTRMMQQAFTSTMNAAGVPSEWISPDGYPADLVPAYFRHADLGMVRQPRPKQSDGRRGLVNTILLDSGRPILIVPFTGNTQAPGRRIVIGWDASRAATRAVHDALPVLVRAKTVDLVTVGDTHINPSLLPTNRLLADHLTHHGVEVKITTLSKSDTSAGDRLLNWAFDKNADLIISGAWGHNRASEYTLGGATRTLLEAMTVPVWMSH